MGFEVKVTAPAIDVALTTAVRRGELAAGGKVIAISDALAPREPEPRHGVHMTETSFVRVELGEGEDTIAVGYDAFWAVLQEENLQYNHVHGGQAKFLSTALITGNDVALEEIAAAIRELFGVSNTSDLLDGTSRVIAAAGIADYPWTGAALVNGAALTWKNMPADPERVVCLTPFAANADQPLLTYGRWFLQVWLRGTDQATDVDDLGDAVFRTLHGLTDRMFGTVHVTQILRESSLPRGMDEQARRHMRSDNYAFDVDYPHLAASAHLNVPSRQFTRCVPITRAGQHSTASWRRRRAPRRHHP